MNMFDRAFKFKRDIVADFELRKLDSGAKRTKMQRLSKNQDATWWNGPGRYAPANLDHVIASDHLKFRQFSGADVDILDGPNWRLMRTR